MFENVRIYKIIMIYERETTIIQQKELERRYHKKMTPYCVVFLSYYVEIKYCISGNYRQTF